MRASRSACVALSNGTRDVADQGKDQLLSLLCGHALSRPADQIVGLKIDASLLRHIHQLAEVTLRDDTASPAPISRVRPAMHSRFVDTKEVRDLPKAPKSINNVLCARTHRNRHCHSLAIIATSNVALIAMPNCDPAW